MIEVFLRSFSPYMDVETCREMVQHPFCSPGTTEGLLSGAISKFRGRLLSQEDSTVLEQALRFAEETSESVKIYDVSRMADNFRALRHGIRSTPTAVIDGKKLEGLEAVLEAVSTRERRFRTNR